MSMPNHRRTRTALHLAGALCLVLVAGCAGQGAGLSKDQQAAALAHYNDTRDPMDRVICKSEATTESRVKTRTCRTKRQWDELRAEAREAIDRSRTGSAYGEVEG